LLNISPLIRSEVENHIIINRFVLSELYIEKIRKELYLPSGTAKNIENEETIFNLLFDVQKFKIEKKTFEYTIKTDGNYASIIYKKKDYKIIHLPYLHQQHQ